jgi:hypothetical protein
LETTAIKLQILRCINVCLFRIPEGVGPESAERNNEYVGPCFLGPIDEIASFSCPQVDQEKGGTGLL